MKTGHNKHYQIFQENSAEVVIPILKQLSEAFGYRLSKIPSNKSK
jgi:hypothetical protein